MDIFETPERQADGSFKVKFVHPPVLTVGELRWEKGASHPTPDLKVQGAIQALREKTIRDLTKNKSLFASTPTQAALAAMTPMWGILVRGGTNAEKGVGSSTLEWSRQDKWDPKPTELMDKSFIVHLVAGGVVISRQSIVPFWGFRVQKILPEAATVIDLDFGSVGNADEDAMSVHSEDLIAEEGVVALKDPEQRKQQMKARVRQLLQTAQEAKGVATEAMEAFFAEFDLSDTESGFSEWEDSDEDD